MCAFSNYYSFAILCTFYQTAFLQGLLQRNLRYVATLNRQHLSNFTINTVQVYGQDKYLMVCLNDFTCFSYFMDLYSVDPCINDVTHFKIILISVSSLDTFSWHFAKLKHLENFKIFFYVYRRIGRIVLLAYLLFHFIRSFMKWTWWCVKCWRLQNLNVTLPVLSMMSPTPRALNFVLECIWWAHILDIPLFKIYLYILFNFLSLLMLSLSLLTEILFLFFFLL